MTEKLILDPECLVFKDKRSVASVKENKATYRLMNDLNLEIGCYHVDGCLIKNGERCDYMLTFDEPKAFVLIELKGKNVEKAMAQLSTTFTAFNKNLNGKFYGRIVTSATYAPALDTNEIKKLKKQFTDSGGNLKIKTSPMEEKTTTLDKIQI